MLFSYVKTAVRSLLRQRGYAVVNVVGLAIGMACCMLVLVYVRHELSYDVRHPHAKRLFRVVSDVSARHAPPLQLRVASGRATFTPSAFLSPGRSHPCRGSRYRGYCPETLFSVLRRLAAVLTSARAPPTA